MTTRYTTAPLLISIKEAAEMLALTTWTVYQMCDSGELKSGYLGKRRLVSVESVRAFAESVTA